MNRLIIAIILTATTGCYSPRQHAEIIIGRDILSKCAAAADKRATEEVERINHAIHTTSNGLFSSDRALSLTDYKKTLLLKGERDRLECNFIYQLTEPLPWRGFGNDIMVSIDPLTLDVHCGEGR